MTKISHRTLHTWLSLAFGLPLILVGLTCFFIAHGDALGTKKVHLGQGVGKASPIEFKAIARIGDQIWVGTKGGLMTIGPDGTAGPIVNAPQDEVRSILLLDGRVLLAGKMGIWSMSGIAPAKLVHSADCWSVSSGQTGFQAACKQKLVVSSDGNTWQELKVKIPEALKNATVEPYTLNKLIMDLHTGKAVFGKDAEWIWIDLLGATTTILGTTGFVMWMRGRKRKSAAI